MEKNNWIKNLKKTVPLWIESIKSPYPGRFKISNNAFKESSIDATSLVIDLHNMLDLQYPYLDHSAVFFNEQQDPLTGFYHEKYVDELDKRIDRIVEMSGTYFGYQISTLLKYFNIKPKYSYSFYDQFLPKDSIENYMKKNMPWKLSPMGAGNMVDHGSTMMRANLFFGDERYRDIFKRMYFLLDDLQDPETGFWGDVNAQGINGLIQGGYHLMRGLYFTDNIVPKYAEKMINTTLKSLNENIVFSEGRGEGCHDMDHFLILERMLKFTGGYRIDEIQEIS